MTTAKNRIDHLITKKLTVSGVDITASAAEINTLDGLTASAAELNLNDGAVAGTAVASKTLALGANKNVDTLVVADNGLKLGSGAGTAITATAAQINTAAVTNANAIIGVAAGYKIARGVSAITGTGTVVTGLTTVVAVIATAQDDLDGDALAGVSATIGDQAGTPAAGSVILKCWKVTTGGAAGNPTLIAATVEKNVNWIAIGT